MAEENTQTRQVGTTYKRFPPPFRSKIRKSATRMDDSGVKEIAVALAIWLSVYAILVIIILYMLGVLGQGGVL